MRFPRTTLIATGFILPSFALGLIVATQPAPHTKPQQHIGLSSATTSTINTSQTEPATTASTSAATTAPTSSNPLSSTRELTTAHTTSLSVTSPASATPTISAAPATPQTNNPTPITATFAELSDWSAPILYTGTTPKEPVGTMVEYKYCTYYYSNGITKQQLYQTQYGSSGAFDNDPNTGGWSVTVDPEIGCAIANAPPVQ